MRPYGRCHSEDDSVKTMGRRTGIDRREGESNIPDNRRIGDERRVALNENDRIVEIMKGIPLFKGLSAEQYRKLLAVCSVRSLKKDSFLCEEGESADEIFILMKGKLKILKKRTLVTSLSPMALIGEIGVFTSGKRTADVLALTECTVIRIHKNELFLLMKADGSLTQRLLINVVGDLAEKIQEDNRIIEELRTRKATMVL